MLDLKLIYISFEIATNTDWTHKKSPLHQSQCHSVSCGPDGFLLCYVLSTSCSRKTWEWVSDNPLLIEMGPGCFATSLLLSSLTLRPQRQTDTQVETLLIPTSRLDTTAMARAEIEDRGQPVVSTSNMWTNQYNQHLTLNNFTLHS